jgi:hypothetical protein
LENVVRLFRLLNTAVNDESLAATSEGLLRDDVQHGSELLYNLSDTGNQQRDAY